MSRDTILKAAKRDQDDGTRWSLNNLASQKHLDGVVTGGQRASLWLTDEAVQLFRAGDYENARLVRELAEKMRKVLVPKLATEAEEHSREHPYIVETRTRVEGEEG